MTVADLEQSSVFDKPASIFKRIASRGVGLPKGGQRNCRDFIASRHVDADAVDIRNIL